MRGDLLQRLVKVRIERHPKGFNALRSMPLENVLDLFENHLHTLNQRFVLVFGRLPGIDRTLQIVECGEQIPHQVQVRVLAILFPFAVDAFAVVFQFRATPQELIPQFIAFGNQVVRFRFANGLNSFRCRVCCRIAQSIREIGCRMRIGFLGLFTHGLTENLSSQEMTSRIRLRIILVPRDKFLEFVEPRLVVWMDIGLLMVCKFSEQFFMLGTDFLGNHHLDFNVQVSCPSATRIAQPLSRKPEDLSGLRPSGYFQLLFALNQGDFNSRAEGCLSVAHGNLTQEVRAFTMKYGVLGDFNFHVEIAGRTTPLPGFAFSPQAEMLTGIDACGDGHAPDNGLFLAA